MSDQDPPAPVPISWLDHHPAPTGALCMLALPAVSDGELINSVNGHYRLLHSANKYLLPHVELENDILRLYGMVTLSF